MKCMSVEETFRPVILAGFCGPLGHGRHRDNEVLIMLNSINHLRRLILYVRFTFSKLNGRECGERNLINPVKRSIHDNNKNANTEKDLQTRIMKLLLLLTVEQCLDRVMFIINISNLGLCKLHPYNGALFSG